MTAGDVPPEKVVKLRTRELSEALRWAGSTTKPGVAVPRTHLTSCWARALSQPKPYLDTMIEKR